MFKIRSKIFVLLAFAVQGAFAQDLLIDGVQASEVTKIFVSKGGYGSNWWDESFGGVYRDFPLDNYTSLISGNCEAGTLVYAQAITVGAKAKLDEYPYFDYCKDGKFNVPVYSVDGVAERVGSRSVDLLIRKCRYDKSQGNGIDCFGLGSTAVTSEIRLSKSIQVSDVSIQNDERPGRVASFGENKYLSLMVQPGTSLLSMPGNNYFYILAVVGNSIFAILPGNKDVACTAEAKSPPPPLKISTDWGCYDMVVAPSKDISNEWFATYENDSRQASRFTFSFGNILNGMSGQVRFYAGYAKNVNDLLENHRWHQVGIYYD